MKTSQFRHVARLALALAGIAPAALATTLGVPACPSVASESRDCRPHVLQLDASVPLSIQAGAVGDVRVVATDRSDVRVELVVTAAEFGVASLVEMVSDSGIVRVLGPANEIWRADVRVEVPRTMDLNIRAERGGITVEGVTGRIELATRVGAVRLLDVDGQVRASTAFGPASVDYSVPTASGSGHVEVSSGVGSVRVQLPKTWSGRVDLRTELGLARNETIWPVRDAQSGGRGLAAALGTGEGPMVVARCGNGGVQLGNR